MMRLKVGKIVNTHSLKGEVKVISSTDFEEERFKKGSKLLITRGNQLIREVVVESYRNHKNFLLVKFEDIDSEGRARQLTGCEVFFERSLSDGAEQGLSWAEIIGFTVINRLNNEVVGHITEVDNTTINTLFEIKTTTGKDILVPAHEELIHEADMQRREIRMSIPDGLLDL